MAANMMPPYSRNSLRVLLFVRGLQVVDPGNYTAMENLGVAR